MPTQIVHDRWDQYLTFASDKPLFVSFDVDATEQDLSFQFPYCARVIVPVKQPNPNGGPTNPESERLYGMEDQLCEVLGQANVVCRLVGRLTHGGKREIVFQLANFDSFRPPVGWWMQQNRDYQIDVSEHDGWEFFNETIRPTAADWLWMRDRDVVNHLLKAGSNPDKPHDIDFTFCGPADGLKRAAVQLAKRGYTAGGKIDFASGSFTAVKRLPLDLEAIHEETLANHELAGTFGITFDGWGAMVVE
jgi:regulator of RNase E activity RraB